MITDELKKIYLAHYQSYDEILSAQENNFKQHLSRLTEQDRKWWFGDVQVDSINDVSRLPVRSGVDILAEQRHRPPYGMWEKGQIVFTSSGSTNGQRKVFPRSLDNYFRGLCALARALENHGVDHTDAVMTTDTGAMFSGHVLIEDAAMFFLNSTRIRTGSPSLTEKLNSINQFKVTVISGSPTKLTRLARLDPKKYFNHKLKMVISTGGPVENQEEIAEAFGVDRILNFYGSAEMFNIAWTCNHGHFHVNIDLCHIEQEKYFTNLISLPVFRYAQGEELYYSYKGTCRCGSNLPTVDKLIVSNSDRSHKD